MKIFLADQIRAADAYTIRNEPITSVDLMERAAGGCAEWVTGNYSQERRILIFVGPGNNGGDGWAMARILWDKGYTQVSVFLVKITDSLSSDSEHNRKRLKKETQVPVVEIEKNEDFPELDEKDVIVDALFGSGISRPISGLAKDLIQHINAGEGAEVVAIDLPSGLFSEDNSQNVRESIIQATCTLSFQFPKLAFFFPENNVFVGSWHIIPIGLHQTFINTEPTEYNYCTLDEMAALLQSRKKFAHKGTYGHGLMIAGSYGMMGAAVLAAKSTLHAGAGLVTTHVPRMGVDILQVAVPESLLSIDESDILFTQYPDLEKYSAIGIGPGLNQKTNTKKAISRLLKVVQLPCVIDADGLNLLAQMDDWQSIIPEHCVLTPHPKEFERLFGTFEDSNARLTAQMEYSRKSKCVVVLKGAHTCITSPEGKAWFNTTGNPGMATGGSGDVLTGIILGLLAQGYTSFDASVLGVYIHGLAGDAAIKNISKYSLTASEIIDSVGIAFKTIEDKKGLL